MAYYAQKIFFLQTINEYYLCDLSLDYGMPFITNLITTLSCVLILFKVMKGYFKNQKATDEMLSKDGWLRTGDIGHYDEDLHFFVTDRIKDLIKVRYQLQAFSLKYFMCKKVTRVSN